MLNALFAATELAFVSISKSQLKKQVQQGDTAAIRVMALRENPERTLSVLQLGITLVGIIAASVGGVAVDEWLSPYLMEQHGFTAAASQVASIIIFVIPYTYANVVLSELLPKSLAFQNPQRVIFRSSRWLVTMGKILAPVVYLLEKTTKLGMRLCAPFFRSKEPVPIQGLLSPYMINLAKMENKTIKDVMIPLEKTVTLSLEDSLDKVERIFLESGHTRLPATQSGKVVGMIHYKEFMTFLREEKEQWQSLLRPPIEVDEEESPIFALRLMQRKRSHLCLVMRGEEVLGIATIEDILEEVVGEIHDEDDVK
jgi:putative hemolysin